MPVPALNVIQSAMYEINILAPGEPLSAADAAWGLEKLQRLIDKWNAVRQVIFSVNFTLYTLIANHAPHTIGPGGDLDTAPAPRPVDIVSASFILNPGTGSNQVDMPLKVRDEQWWADNPVKSLTSSICTDVYYDPAAPLGNLNFWPICNIANPVRLEAWNSLVAPAVLTTQLGFATGYWDATVLTLAVELCSAFGVEPTPTLGQRQRDALKIIMGNNAHPPRIRTDNSMPTSGRGGRPDFNFLTGLRE